MKKDQQTQARATFNEIADAWQKLSQKSEKYSLVQNRNALVLKELSSWPQCSRFLDIGCGTGQLVVEAASSGHQAKGIDYSSAMIDHCRDNARKAQVDAEFELISIFDVSTASKEYDVISALGFIEYLPRTQLDTFINKVTDMLAIDGKLLVGSRNRLFNVTSLNEFTDIEIELGNFDNLLRQAMAFQSAEAQDTSFTFLEAFVNAEPQPNSHPNTGVNVDTRYQYSPGEIYSRLQAAGYRLDAIYPVHFHAFPPQFKKDNLVEHERIARFIQEQAPSDIRVIPWCSTLIFVASRDI